MRQRITDKDRGFADLFPTRLLDRIKIEVKVIGPIDIVAARVPLVQIDAAEVDYPQERAEIADNGKIDDVSGRMLDGAGLDPFRSGLRSALHEEKLTGRAVRIALHHHCAMRQMREQDVSDINVVLA